MNHNNTCDIYQIFKMINFKNILGLSLIFDDNNNNYGYFLNDRENTSQQKYNKLYCFIQYNELLSYKNYMKQSIILNNNQQKHLKKILINDI